MYLVTWIDDIVRTAYLVSALCAEVESYMLGSSLCNVCLQTALTVSPALTLMIPVDGVVGFGPPLQATYCEVTSVMG
jgi:hypothetical protein